MQYFKFYEDWDEERRKQEDWNHYNYYSEQDFEIMARWENESGTGWINLTKHIVNK